MDLTQALSDWRSRGFAVLPGYLPGDVLAPPLAELELMFPSAEGFHGGRDPRRGRFVGDEFAGIDSFPCASTKISLLAMHDCLVHLARTLLRSDDLRIYTAEAWAKYTGANDYDQELHRDYLNHTLVVPPCGTEQQQVEMFVYLVDVPDGLGPPRLVPTEHTADLPAKPNWYPRQEPSGSGDVDAGAPTGFVAPARPELCEREVSAAGPAGTVVAFQLGTFHRGTALTPSRRRTLHHASRLPARESRVEPPSGLGGSQPQSGLVPLRRTCFSSATRTLRVPASLTSLLDSPHPRRHSPPLPGPRPVPWRAGLETVLRHPPP